MSIYVYSQNLLMDVRDKLLFEPEYAGNIREKVPPKSSLRIPWAWLPGALCLLQEVQFISSCIAKLLYFHHAKYNISSETTFTNYMDDLNFNGAFET